MSATQTAIKYPRVSVLIPVRNEAMRIASCLEALNQTTYPRDQLEILVLDGESEDATAEIAQQFPLNGLTVRVLKNPKRTRGAAINLGIEAAKGEVVMCLDARNLCPPDYVRTCVETLLAQGADNVGGVIEPVSEVTTQEAVGLAMSHPFGIGFAPFRLGHRRGNVYSVYLGCFRRSVFDRVGLFDERPDVGEDADMNLRIRQSGGVVYLDPKIRMPYQVRDRFRDLWRLFYRYGIQRVGILFKHGRFTAPRQVVPGLFLLTVVTLGVLSFWSRWCAWLLLVVVGVYVLLDLGVAASLSFRRRKLVLLPLLCVAFPCMHIAYALGFLRRVVWRPSSDRFLKA